MRHTISLQLDELNSGLIDQLKELFKNAQRKQVTIIVDDEADETAYLLESPANRERLFRSLENARHGNVIIPDLESYRKTATNA
jgi:hypothetical protein